MTTKMKHPLEDELRLLLTGAKPEMFAKPLSPAQIRRYRRNLAKQIEALRHSKGRGL